VILPTEYPDYSKVEYWNNRYKEERGQTFDWFVGYQSLREIIVPRLFDDKESEILILGCGNSGKLLISTTSFDDYSTCYMDVMEGKSLGALFAIWNLNNE
jgi:hypothetical protein